MKSQFYLSFGRSNLVSCENVRRTTCKSQFYLSFWRSNLISCERVAPDKRNWNFSSAFGDQTSFRAKRLRRTREIAILPKFLPNFISCERVAIGHQKSQFYLSSWRSNLISCERVAFRAVSLALPRAFKREIEKKERARGQEEDKRARGQERM